MKKKPRRTKTTTTVSLRISDDLIARIDAYGEKTHQLTRTGAIEDLLRRMLDVVTVR